MIESVSSDAMAGLLDQLSQDKNHAERLNIYKDFCQQGWPTQKKRRYRWVDFSMISDKPWQFSQKQNHLDLHDVVNEEAWVLLWVNGHFHGMQHQPSDFPGAMTLSHGLSQSSLGDAPFSILSQCFSANQHEIVLKQSKVLAHPIYIVHWQTDAFSPITSQVKQRIVLEPNSKAEIRVQYLGEGSEALWLNHEWDIVLEKNAHCALNFLQEPKGEVYQSKLISASLGQHAQFNLRQVNIGLHWAFEDVLIKLQGEGSEFSMTQVTALQQSQPLSQSIKVLHQASHTRSQVLARSLLGGTSRHHLQMHAHIEPKVVGCSAEQNHRTLLASGSASVHSDPQLIIANDDVSCAHGSTVSQLDPKDIFYLQSRGFSHEQALNVLSMAFLTALIDVLDMPNWVLLLQVVGQLFDQESMLEYIECK